MRKLAVVLAVPLVVLALGVLFPGAAHADSIYVSNCGNTIQEFDLTTGADLGTFASTGLNYPSGLAFDSSGNLYVANWGNNTIHEFGPTGADLGVFASTGLNRPFDLAFDSSGNLYVANMGNYTIHEFGPTGADLGTFAGGLESPQGLAFDSSGNLYVGNHANTIHKFGPTGADLGIFASTGLSTSVPLQGLAFDSSGNLYVTYGVNNTIHEFGPTGADLGTFAGGLECPQGLAFDSSGNLYVVNIRNNTIHEFGPTGADLGIFASSGLYYPVGIAIRRTVQDTTPPTIVPPHDVTVDESDPLGTPVTFPEPTVTDNCDADVEVRLDPASGSLFMLGDTTVTCTATDHSGNTATATFVVHVLPGPPANQLDNAGELIEDAVASGKIAPELEQSLGAKVAAAMAALARGNPNDAKAAMNDLKALVNQVEAQTGKKIDPAVAAEVIRRANRIIAALGGQ